SELLEGIESRIELIDFELIKTNTKLKELKRMNSERLKTLKKSLSDANTAVQILNEKEQNLDLASKRSSVKSAFEKKAMKLTEEIQKEKQRIQLIADLLKKYGE
ncbi:MAG: hypothetical protein JW703_02810, partial [Candidatus Diapherotrites archaeon]|nr:hypothetical protein [Candidatus Diapherotrites archaeon]